MLVLARPGKAISAVLRGTKIGAEDETAAGGEGALVAVGFVILDINLCKFSANDSGKPAPFSAKAL